MSVEVKLKTETIAGTVVTFEVDGDGRFTARVDGGPDLAWGETLQAVRAKVVAKLRQSRAKIEVLFFDVNTKEHRVATGVHQGTGHPLVQKMHGKGSEQFSRYGYRTTLRALTEEEVAEFKRLDAEQTKAILAYNAFVKNKDINLDHVVKQAIEKASGSVAVVDEDDEDY